MKSNPPNEPLIVTIREQRVVLDADLASIYGVETKVFNQAIKRNRARFPSDFAFQLTAEEFADLRSQTVTLKTGLGKGIEVPIEERSQNVTLKKGRGQHRRVSPVGLHRARCAHGGEHPSQ